MLSVRTKVDVMTASQASSTSAAVDVMTAGQTSFSRKTHTPCTRS